MIFNYSALRGGGLATLGSFSVHLPMLLATWITMESLTSDDEFVDGLVRPRLLLILLSIVHILASLS